MICTNTPNTLMVAKNESARFVLIFHPACHNWSCESCAKDKAAQISIHSGNYTSMLLEQGAAVFFCTVTSHERLYSPDLMKSAFRVDWPKLRKRVQRRCFGFHYFGVPEGHTDKRLHFHFLTTEDFTERWLKDNGRECGFGYMNDVEPCSSPKQASRYMTKYLAKSLATENWPRNFMRLRHSQCWPEIPAMPGLDEWQFGVQSGDVSEYALARMYETAGYQVVITDHKASWKVLRSIA